MGAGQELYERPAASAAPSIRAIPALFSPNDHWEVLLWAAITCATVWHRALEADYVFQLYSAALRCFPCSRSPCMHAVPGLHCTIPCSRPDVGVFTL